MVQLLGLIGILIVGLTLWKDKERQARQKEELKEFKNVRDDLVKARKDVGNLLEQLEKTSEKIVGEITQKLEEMDDIEQINELKKMSEKAKEEQKTEEQDKPDTLKLAVGNNSTVNDSSIKNVSSSRENNSKNRHGARNKTIMFPTGKQKSSGETYKKIKEDKTTFTEPNAKVQGKEISPKQQMVYAMDKLGCTEEEIAKQMNMGKGEVRLILELKRKGEEYNA